jgi:hypothetical protein
VTDAELLAYLHNSKGWPTLGKAAADRIEALIVERDEQIEWVKRFADMQIASEAKLAKVVEALRDAVHAWDNHNKTGDMMQGHWVTDARAVLAEIEGEKG